MNTTEMIFLVYWTSPRGGKAHGYVKAKNEEDAKNIMEMILQRECKVTEIHEAKLHQITPQSLTINFENQSEYTSF